MIEGYNNAASISNTSDDIQAIGWPNEPSLLYQARKRRLTTYCGYTNIPGSQDNFATVVDSRFTNERLFAFNSMFTYAKPSLLHFQLRNLVIPLSKNTVLYSDKYSVQKLNPEEGSIEEVFDRFVCSPLVSSFLF